MPIERKKTRQIRIGDVPVGGDAPVSLQSMTTTKTADINATLQQIASLVAAGVDIVRVAVPHWEDAEALVAIAAKSTVPVVADIHFQWKYAIAALEAGIQGLRINPGNIKYQDKVRLIAREAKAREVPIRIGVNAGSLEKDLLAKYGAPTPEALVESALSEARILEDEEFFDIKISVKHSNPAVMIEAYRRLAEACDYPLHLGVTEAGPMPMGGIVSTSVTRAASGAGTISITTAKHPAFSSAMASSTSRSAESPRPCTRYPPRTCSLCGVKPMWPITGMPARTRSSISGTMSLPPSSLTACAMPSFMKRVAVASAVSAIIGNKPRPSFARVNAGSRSAK